MEKLYEAEVTTLAGRNGHAKSSDGLLDVDIRFPKEMGGAGGATNPEQLFAAAWSACFGTSVTAAAGIEKVKIGEVTVTAKIGVLHDNGSLVAVYRPQQGNCRSTSKSKKLFNIFLMLKAPIT